MNIYGLDKAQILVVLFNKAKKAEPEADSRLTLEESKEILKASKKIGFLRGKFLRINLEGDELDTQQYNEINGEHAAEGALDEIIKLTPPEAKPLLNLCANYIAINKTLFFNDLDLIPVHVRTRFPELEVNPRTIFINEVKAILNSASFDVSTKEEMAICELKAALNTANLYNSIHKIVQEIQVKFKQFPVEYGEENFKPRMQPIVKKIIDCMFKYVKAKDEYMKRDLKRHNQKI